MALYVYGVVSASAPVPGTEGIGGAQLELITEDELGALVSVVPDLDLSMGRDALDAHARVLQEAHAHSTVLPMRFGMIMADRDEVVGRLLVRFGGDLREQLVRFADTVELKLRATYVEEQVMREIVREDREIARLRQSLRDLPRDAGYYGQIRLGELVAQALERKRDRDAAGIIDALGPLTLAMDVSPPPNERIVVAASFLVSRAQVATFDDAVNRVGEAQAGRMRFAYTGPFPPHSFVALAQVAVTVGLFTGLLTLPLAPVRGVVWVSEKLMEEAERQYYDENAIRTELLELEDEAERGNLSREEIRAREDELLQRLAESQARRQAAARSMTDVEAEHPYG